MDPAAPRLNSQEVIVNHVVPPLRMRHSEEERSRNDRITLCLRGVDRRKQDGSGMDTDSGTISPASHCTRRGVLEGNIATLLAAFETRECEERSMSK